MDTAESNLRQAMQLEVERVLMSGTLDTARIVRVEAMLQATKMFFENTEGFADLPTYIQAERLRQLGFSPEVVESLRASSENENRAAAEGLVRSAQVFGVGEDDEPVSEENEVDA